MAVDKPLLLTFFAGILICLLALREAVARRTTAITPEAPHPDQGRQALSLPLPTLICAFLCLVGLLLLIPWAASLSSEGAVGLLVGIAFAGPLALGLLHTLARNGPAA